MQTFRELFRRKLAVQIVVVGFGKMEFSFVAAKFALGVGHAHLRDYAVAVDVFPIGTAFGLLFARQITSVSALERALLEEKFSAVGVETRENVKDLLFQQLGHKRIIFIVRQQIPGDIHGYCSAHDFFGTNARLDIKTGAAVRVTGVETGDFQRVNLAPAKAAPDCV